MSDNELTVADVVRMYLADRRAEGQDTARAERQFEAHVLPRWGSARLADLTAPALRAWRDQLAATPPRLRTSQRGQSAQRFAAMKPDDDEARRKRRSTVNRITTQLKAALNHAARLHPGACPNPNVWREGLRAFRSVDAPRERWLTRDEAKRLIGAGEPAFARLVTAALYTGCRYGELCRAKVRDYDPTTNLLRVPVTKSGRARDVVLTDEAGAFLRELAGERPPSAPLLTRPPYRGERSDSAAWGPGHQVRPMQRACRAAGIEPPVTFHALRHTHASLAVQSGMTLIALAKNLGHADTRMVERHYGHLSDAYLRSQVAAHAFSLR